MSLAGRVLIGLRPLFLAFLFLSCSSLEDGVCWPTCRLRRITFPLHFYRSFNYSGIAPFLQTTKGPNWSSNAALRCVPSDFCISYLLHDIKSHFWFDFYQILGLFKSHWQIWKQSCSDIQRRLKFKPGLQRLHRRLLLPSSSSCSHCFSHFLHFFPPHISEMCW